MTGDSETVAAVRRFNRFYTRAVGVLDDAFLGGPYTLAESRVLYEIAEDEGVTAREIGAALDLDPGYLSRMISRLQRDGLLTREPSPRDGRSAELHLTDTGRAHFAQLNSRMVGRIEDLMRGLSTADRLLLSSSLDDVRCLLAAPTAPEPVVLRSHRPGDMGWVVERHADIYSREYGWGSKIEGVTARVVADFLETFDPALERCWIAQRGETRLGCVFMVREPNAPGVARLRLLILDPEARGLGPGAWGWAAGWWRNASPSPGLPAIARWFCGPMRC